MNQLLATKAGPQQSPQTYKQYTFYQVYDQIKQIEGSTSNLTSSPSVLRKVKAFLGRSKLQGTCQSEPIQIPLQASVSKYFSAILGLNQNKGELVSIKAQLTWKNTLTPSILESLNQINQVFYYTVLKYQIFPTILDSSQPPKVIEEFDLPAFSSYSDAKQKDTIGFSICQV
ncbi:hypothetical protein ABPG72_016621 [Tetrahymena utriculariae]